MIGGNTSFSFTFSNMNEGIIDIHHTNSLFAVLWPETNFIRYNNYPRVSIVMKSNHASDTTNVTISISNLTKHDSGIYTAIRRLNPKEVVDSVLLETNDETLIPIIETVLNHGLDSTLVLKCKVSSASAGKILWSLNGSLIESGNTYFQRGTCLYIRNVTTDDTYKFYSCKEDGSKLESDPYIIPIVIDHYITASTTSIANTTGMYIDTTMDIVTYIDAEGSNTSNNGSPAERYFLFNILVLGIIFASATIIYLWKRRRSRVRGSKVDPEPINDDENDGLQNRNQASKYWTIVSNAKGELSTAVESNSGLQRGSPLVVPNKIPRGSDYEDSFESDDIGISQEIAGYLNPISTSMNDFGGYIHPIQSNPLNMSLPRPILDSQICTLNMNMHRDLKSLSI